MSMRKPIKKRLGAVVWTCILAGLFAALASTNRSLGQSADAPATNESLIVRVTADRSDALYLNSEKAGFAIEVTSGKQRADRGELEVWLSQDGNPTKIERKRFDLAADAPIRVSGSVDEPAFFLCQAWATVGAAKGYGEKVVWYRAPADTTRTAVELVTDRQDALYGVGESATFAARVTKNGQRVTDGYLELRLSRNRGGEAIARP